MSGRRSATREVYADLQWDPIPAVPRGQRRRVARADRLLVRYVRHRDLRALADLAAVLDEVVADPAFTGSDGGFRTAVLNRAGIAHNWLGIALSPDPADHLGQSAAVLRRGIAGVVKPAGMRWRLLTNLSSTLVQRYAERGSADDLEAAVEAGRTAVAEAVRHAPASAAALARSAFSLSLQRRFRYSGDRADLDEATEQVRSAVRDSPEGVRRTYFRFTLSEVLQVRYDVTSSLADLDEAETLLRTCLAAPATPIQLSRDGMTGTLASVLRRRFIRTRDPADLDEAIALFRQIPGTTQPARLTNLGNALLDRYYLTGDSADLEAAVTAQLRSVELTRPGDWQLASRHNNAGNALAAAAAYEDDPELARQAVGSYRQSLAMTAEHAPERSSREYNLANSLRDLCGDDRSGPGVTEASGAYADAVRHGRYGSLEWALAAGRNWGRWAARREAWPEAAVAYGSAVEVAQRLFRVQLVRSEQETWLAELQGLPGEAANAMARAGRPADAVEALERARALLLSDALARDRADLAQLSATHPHLAAAYRDAVRDLTAELGKTSGPQTIRVARDRLDRTVAEIRAVPGHGDFLADPGAAALVASLATNFPDGAVAYLVPAPGGGIGLVVAHGEIRTVDLPRCTVEACRLRESAFLAVRGTVEADSGQFAGTLDAVTRWLWDVVVGPVLDTVTARRLVLIPVGALALLPLHAAWTGTAGAARYATDETAVGYAPSAQALLACLASARNSRAERAVAVADPQPTGLTRVGYADAEVAWTLAGRDGTALRGSAATRSAVLAEVARADVVHLACHGSSRPDRPVESGVTLAHDERLTLADLLGARLRGSAAADGGARLVILSACGTDQPGIDLPDEVVSLPTGLVQAGSAGVVAAQWAIRSLAAALFMAAFQASWRIAGNDPLVAVQHAQQWLRTTTNEEKAADLTTWSAQLGVPGQRAVLRALKLRNPAARDFAELAQWAAISFHGF